jgi:HSP20 family protein
MSSSRPRRPAGTLAVRIQRTRYRFVALPGRPEPIPDAFPWTRPRVPLARPLWRPAADVYQGPRAVTVTVDLAGVAADDMELLLFEDALVVDGIRSLRPVEGEGVFHAAEIRHGRFRLEVALPVAVDPDSVEARHEGGLLVVTLPSPRGHGNGR